MGGGEGDEDDDYSLHCAVGRVAFVGGEFHEGGRNLGGKVFPAQDELEVVDVVEFVLGGEIVL